MSVFTHKEFDQHEMVAFHNDNKTGLQAIIAIHNSNLGPGSGGCRMYPYADPDAALNDVLRLSRGMTYKSALAGIPLGGGKSVIIGDPRFDKTTALMHAMGEFIESLGGRYIAAEDSGTSVEDMKIINEKTSHVSGININNDISGDPSPSTAYGVYCGIKAAVKYKLGHDDLHGLRVAIQGVGNVGYHLARYLSDDSATVFVGDIVAENIKKAVKDFDAIPVACEDIIGINADVFAPCAMGAVINDDTMDAIQAPIIAGAANNQLAVTEHAAELMKREILYVPDFVINAGGIIDIYYQISGIPREQLNGHIEQITATLNRIFLRADKEMTDTNTIAENLAREIFNPNAAGSHSEIQQITSDVA